VLVLILSLISWSYIQIYKCKIFRVLEASDSLADIRDQDTLVAYRVQKYTEDSILIVFNHERLVER
jgi:ubiquitin carboxyl-terminal hydrolase 4/11/15